MFRTVLFLSLLGLLYCFCPTGCAPRHNTSLKASLPSPHKKVEPICYYLVKRGDSLWAIAQQYNVSIDTLKRKNSIEDPSQLKAGQLLAVPSLSQDQQEDASFTFPVKGKIIGYFGEVADNRINKGIKIRTEPGAEVFSSLAGEVVFIGFINGYGQTVIVEHCNNISTVYSYLTDIEVEQGDFIAQGQPIGKVQLHPTENIHVFHFEVRKGQKATDPLRYVRSYE